MFFGCFACLRLAFAMLFASSWARRGDCEQKKLAPESPELVFLIDVGCSFVCFLMVFIGWNKVFVTVSGVLQGFIVLYRLT